MTVPTAEQFRPGRLWSLWDMLKINAGVLYSIAGFLGHAKTVNNHLINDESRKDELDHILLKGDKETIRRAVDDVRLELKKVGAKLSLMTAERLLKKLNGKQLNYRTLNEILVSLDERVRDELSLVKLYVIEATKSSYFEPVKPHFGDEVEQNFPTAVFEIEEAGRCFALSRHTASVFHLMRTMEVGIRAVARCLSIPDPLKAADKNWGSILRDVKLGLEERGGNTPAKTWANSTDKQFFEMAFASLDAVRSGWRNSTMHVESKYTDEEAEHIFGAVKGFMRKLASRMDERGEPRA
jgi:hypothetical protein